MSLDGSCPKPKILRYYIEIVPAIFQSALSNSHQRRVIPNYWNNSQGLISVSKTFYAYFEIMILYPVGCFADLIRV